MKKIMFFALAVLMVMAFTMPAGVFADSQTWTDGTFNFGNSNDPGTRPDLEYGLSNNVHLNYAVDAPFQNYGIAALHKSGNRTYGTSNDTTLIFYEPKSVGTTTGTQPVAGESTWSGWTSM